MLCAILHRDPKKLNRTVLNVYKLHSRSQKFSLQVSTTVSEEGGMERDYYIVHVPLPHGQCPHGGIAVIGGQDVVLFSIRDATTKGTGKATSLTFDKKVTKTRWPYSIISAYVHSMRDPIPNFLIINSSVTHVDEDSARYIIGDHFGRYALLALTQNSTFKVVELGEVDTLYWG